MVINKPEWKCDGPLMINDIGWCYTIENAKPKNNTYNSGHRLIFNLDI